jgi:hypothetical protein
VQTWEPEFSEAPEPEERSSPDRHYAQLPYRYPAACN